MQVPDTPLIVRQPRSAAAIAALLQARLRSAGFGVEIGAEADPLRDALVHIGARYAEILVEHLNAAPALHRDAFLASLGGEQTQALPARVVLGFTPVPARAAAGNAVAGPVVVPAHTPVAAAPLPGDSEAVVFETEHDLALVRAEALGAWAVDPHALRWADAGSLLAPAGFACEHLFAGAVPLERALHIAAPQVLGLPDLARVVVEVHVHQSAAQGAGAAAFEWGVSGAEGFERLAVESDSTEGLKRSGVVVLHAPAVWPPGVVGGVESLWLTCRVAPAPDGVAFPSPRLGVLRVGARVRAEPQVPAALAWGSVPLDASRDIFPFGERPRFGELFHLMAPAFAVPGARIVLDLRLTNPAGEPQAALPPVDRKGQPRVRWEANTRRGWVALDAADGTESFTRHGEVSFVLPADVQPSMLAGQPGPWIRARLVSGHYGAPQLVDGLPFPAAPAIESLRLAAEADVAPAPPERLSRAGVLELAAVDLGAPSFEPFPPPDVEGPALYVALAAHEPLLAGRELSFQVHPGEPAERPVWRDGRAGAAPPRWQQRAGDGWRDCAVADDSQAFTRPGIARVRLAAEPAPWPGATVPLPPAAVAARPPCWLRIVWPAGAAAPRLRRLVLNAVHARQTMRLENEILGSSTGRPGQSFTALRKPIIGDVRLEVRDAAPPDGTWVVWERVSDFSASDAAARHFVLDPRSGVLRFGDGRQGRIPPPGANNIRLREYHVGGGRRGNVPALAAAQLRKTVPYVQAVANREAAAGGQDAGDVAAVRRAASGWLRHRDRAVCAEDYVDLCLAASPEVARAWCSGCRDLDAARPAVLAPGVVSLVVLPHGAQYGLARPQPTPDLLERVKVFLDARRPLNTELVLLGPQYVPVALAARVAAVPGGSAHDVAAACRRRLWAYLHPVNGGERGGGWAPGARPHRSDLVALLGGVDGVDHVVDLRWAAEDAELEPAAQALVCAGAVEVSA